MGRLSALQCSFRRSRISRQCIRDASDGVDPGWRADMYKSAIYRIVGTVIFGRSIVSSACVYTVPDKLSFAHASPY